MDVFSVPWTIKCYYVVAQSPACFYVVRTVVKQHVEFEASLIIVDVKLVVLVAHGVQPMLSGSFTVFLGALEVTSSDEDDLVAHVIQLINRLKALWLCW